MSPRPAPRPNPAERATAEQDGRHNTITVLYRAGSTLPAPSRAVSGNLRRTAAIRDASGGRPPWFLHAHGRCPLLLGGRPAIATGMAGSRSPASSRSVPWHSSTSLAAAAWRKTPEHAAPTELAP